MRGGAPSGAPLFPIRPAKGGPDARRLIFAGAPFSASKRCTEAQAFRGQMRPAAGGAIRQARPIKGIGATKARGEAGGVPSSMPVFQAAVLCTVGMESR